MASDSERDRIVQDVIHYLSLQQAGENKSELSSDYGRRPLRLARVVRNDPSKNRVMIRFFGTDMYQRTQQIEAIYPGYMGAPDGTGIWHGLSAGDTVLVANTNSDKFIILNKITNIASSSLDPDSILEDVGSFEGIKSGGFAIRTRVKSGTDPCELMTIEAIPNSGILIGMSPFSSIKFDYFPNTNDSSKYDSVFSLTTGQSYKLTEAGYVIDGIVLRNVEPKDESTIDARNQEKWYEFLQPVCLDPTRNRVNKTENATRIKNPPFIEKREVIYEFAESSVVESDSLEVKKQNPQSFELAEKTSINRRSTNRRSRKEDVLSLSLVSPNYLIESIKGTLVDTFGNVLDLNRHKLPIGKNELVSLDGTDQAYKNLRELHRKGVAFHWELNARKDTKEAPIETGKDKSYAETENTYTRERRRFFFDIDKEGQFKLTVPASSEKGNIALIANYENNSTINPTEDDDGNNYNSLVSPEEGKQDILLDAFGKGCVSLKGSEKLIPKDRKTGQAIKLGTVFHDISKTCCEPAFVDPNDKDLGAAIFAGPDGDPKGNILTSIVTNEINIDGDEANAGGRSGTFLFDGMVNLNIGANTIDRQSLWLDTEGGIISRIGRDKNNISMATQLDGHYYLQIGGNTIDDDKRYLKEGFDINANRNFIFEIRLIDGNNNYHRINIDENGILLRSAANIRLETKDNIILHAAKVISNCEIEEKYTTQYDYDIWKRVKMFGLISRLIASTDSYESLGSDGGPEE